MSASRVAMDQRVDLSAHQNSALPTVLAEDLLDGVMVDIDIGTSQFLSRYSSPTAQGGMEPWTRLFPQSPFEISIVP